MTMMKFLRLYLVSHQERRGLSMEFDTGATVVQAPNGFGKSALLKSLYDTFGAEPHLIDDSWRKANVTSAVDFEIGGELRTILKFAGTYTVFDSNGSRIFQTTSVTRGLAPFIADLLDFRLLMTDRYEQVVTPPPAYAFAPYYVDQDKSWSSAWQSFNRMYLPRTAGSLADYHSGRKTNAYYLAQAERDLLTTTLKEIELRRRGITDALKQVREIELDTSIFFDIEDFEAETKNLLAESRYLYSEQVSYRGKLTELTEARSLWSAQIAVTTAALAEFNNVFDIALGRPSEVECPTCGEHYVNNIAARFNIAADAEALIAVLREAQEKQRALDVSIDAARSDIDEISKAIARVHAILSVQRDGLSFGEIVAAEGRNAASRILRERGQSLDDEIGSYSTQIKELNEQMKRAMDRKRSRLIQDYFSVHLAKFAAKLDVRVQEAGSKSLSNVKHARGSEGPRGLAAFYYAFLYTARNFGSAAFCPLVIDAPNQQGQDANHLPAIISFLVRERPEGAQLILGVEDPVGITENDARIVKVGERKNQLLSDDQFEQIASHLRPYLSQSI